MCFLIVRKVAICEGHDCSEGPQGDDHKINKLVNISKDIAYVQIICTFILILIYQSQVFLHMERGFSSVGWF